MICAFSRVDLSPGNPHTHLAVLAWCQEEAAAAGLFLREFCQLVFFNPVFFGGGNETAQFAYYVGSSGFKAFNLLRL